MNCRALVLSIAVTCFAMAPLAAQTPAQQVKKRSVEGLIYDLKHPEADRRKEAATMLGMNRIREAVPGLIELTSDSDDLIRLEAVRALVRINDPQALEAYIRLTQDPKKDTQRKSIEGIVNLYVVEEGGFIQTIRKFVDFVNPFSDDYNPLIVEPYVPVSEAAISGLAALLNSPDPGLRKDAATALGILRAHSVLPTIRESLARETDNAVKVELIRAIYKIADPSAGASVVPLIRDPDRKVQEEAIFTTGRLRVSDAVPDLMEIYQSAVPEKRKLLGIVPAGTADDYQRRLLEALAQIGDPRCKDIFLSALQDERDTFRHFAAEGLGRMGDQSVTTAVATQYLQDKSKNARLAMSFALFRLGREEHLVDLVQNLNDGNQAFDYLLELKPEEVPKLYPHVHAQKNPIKARLLDIVGLRGDQSALPLAEQMTQSENADVVSAANLAIRRLRGRHEVLDTPNQTP